MPAPDFTPEDAFPDMPSAASPDETLRYFGRTQAWQQNARYARLNDPTVNMLHTLIAKKFNNNDSMASSAWANSDPGKATREIIGMAGANGMLGGGSSTALMGGLMQMTQASNFRVNSFGAGATQLSGGGLLTDMISRRLYDNVTQTMFNKAGFADTNQTAGFDKTQMGSIFGLMGQRGMMSGMSGISLGQDPTTHKLDTQIQSGTTDKIKSMLTDTAKMLAAVKDITGLKEITDLAAAAEGLSGMSMRGADSPRSMTDRLERLKRSANTMGLSVSSVAQSQLALTAMGQDVVGRGLAASMAARSIEGSSSSSLDRMSAITLARGRGEHLGNFTSGEMASQSMQSQMQLLAQNPLLLEGAYAAQNITGTDETRSALQASMDAFGKVSSREERIAAQADLRTKLEAHTKSSAGTLTRTVGASSMFRGLSAETQDKLSATLEGQDQAMNKNLLTDLLAKNRNFGHDIGLDGNRTGGAVGVFAQGLDSARQNELIEALKADGTDHGSRGTALIDANSQELLAGGISQKALTDLRAAAANDPTKLRALLHDTRQVTADMKQFSNMTTVQGRNWAADVATSNTYAQNMAGGSDAQIQPDFLTSLAQGLMHGGTVDNQSVLGYLNYSKQKLGEFGMKDNYVEDSEELRKTLNTYGDPKDKVFDKYMEGTTSGSSEWKKKSMEFLNRHHVVYGRDGSNTKMQIATSDQAKGGRTDVSGLVEARQLAALDGDTTDKHVEEVAASLRGYKAATEGSGTTKEAAAAAIKKKGDENHARIVNALTGKTKGEWIDQASAAGDFENDAFNQALELSKKDQAGFAKTIAAAHKKIDSEGMDDADKKHQRIKDMEAKVKEATKTAAERSLDQLMKISKGIDDLNLKRK